MIEIKYSGYTQSYMASETPSVDSTRPKSRMVSSYDKPLMEGSPFGGGRITRKDKLKARKNR